MKVMSSQTNEIFKTQQKIIIFRKYSDFIDEQGIKNIVLEF